MERSSCADLPGKGQRTRWERLRRTKANSAPRIVSAGEGNARGRQRLPAGLASLRVCAGVAASSCLPVEDDLAKASAAGNILCSAAVLGLGISGGSL